MDILDRLNDRLLQALDQRTAAPDDSFTIAEIYQQLIPYRAMRGALGIVELAPYEHALLRLLSGERGYLTVMDPSVADEILRELAEPNPILGIYRDYADVEVRLGTVAVPELELVDEGDDEEEAPDPSPPPAQAPAATPASAATPAPAAAAPSRPRGACSRCREPLPTAPGLRYCPACGADQAEAPCVACGAPVRAEWSFCIRCGKRQPDRAEPPPART